VSSNLSRPVATVSADGSTITHKRGAWALTFPAADLPYWLSIYEGLRDRSAGAFAAFHTPNVEALDKARRILNAMRPIKPKGGP